MAATSAPIFASTNQLFFSSPDASISNPFAASKLLGTVVPKSLSIRKKQVKISRKVKAAVAVSSPAVEEVKEHVLPSWAAFEIGRAPVYWKTMNGLPPSSGEKLKLFYNPAATNIKPNEEFGIAFNGGFNQPIMCGGEPRAMLKKTRGKADPPYYTIQILVPKHALNLIFSFTNGSEWDGPYRLQFQVPKAWRNKPYEFFYEGLNEELSKEGACDRAIFPDTDIVIDRCAISGNLSKEGGDRCELNFVPGCMDPNNPSYNPDANLDDGTCEIDLES